MNTRGLSPVDVEVLIRTREALHAIVLPQVLAFSLGMGPTLRLELTGAPLARAVAQGLVEDLTTLAGGTPPARLVKALGFTPPPGSCFPMPPNVRARYTVRDVAGGLAAVEIILERRS